MDITRHVRAGFTLIEILIVVAIMGALMTFFFGVIPRVTRAFYVYRTTTAISEVKSALIQYQLSVGKYPVKLRELVKGPKEEAEKKKWVRGGGPFLEEEPGLDPWGSKYVYKLNPPGSKKPYLFYSYGVGGPGSPKENWID